jgi:hypothetical protein
MRSTISDIADGRDGFQRHVTSSLDRPFVVLFEQDGADETLDSGLVGECYIAVSSRNEQRSELKNSRSAKLARIRRCRTNRSDAKLDRLPRANRSVAPPHN